MEPAKSVRVLIEGRVQGVWYRGWTVREATAHDLDGWVRNLSDGRVEAVFHGPADRVDRMVQACRAGPPSAHVTALAVEPWADHPGHGFHQRPTA